MSNKIQFSFPNRVWERELSINYFTNIIRFVSTKSPDCNL
jgi:hypothetical protein